MKRRTVDIAAFVALVRAGLWEREASLAPFKGASMAEVYRLAQEQTVTGLVYAGLKRLTDTSVTEEELQPFKADVENTEQNNFVMDHFIGVMAEKMMESGIRLVLIKGQGIAQCYERPMWRSSGDVDLLLDDDNFAKAKDFLLPLSSNVDLEGEAEKHIGLFINPWEVELHGNLSFGLSSRIDKELSGIQKDILNGRDIRYWHNGNTAIPLPGAGSDIVFVFTHVLKHFFKLGIGLRQICDWCRLVWTYRNEIDRPLLEKRLRRMGLMTEWKAFACLAVNVFGMPAEAMPLYSSSLRWRPKARRILSLVLEYGNFGQNRDNSYYQKTPFLVRKAISLWRHTWDFLRQFFIFPVDSVRAWRIMLKVGLNNLG